MNSNTNTNALKKKSVCKRIGNMCGSIFLTFLCGCAGPSQFGFPTLLHEDYVNKRNAFMETGEVARKNPAPSLASGKKVFIED